MPNATAGTTLRIVGYAVLLLMLASIVYAGVITTAYWHGIGV